MNVYIIIPAYNEEECIGEVVKEWHGVVQHVSNDSKLVVLNDGSKDKTLQKLISFEKEYPQLVVIDKKNSGHGQTCMMGYTYAIDHGADYVFQTDSDGQTKPEEFYKFWESRNDFSIGYRKSRGDGVGRWIISRVLRLVIFFVFFVWVKDSNVPFRLMRTEKLKHYLQQVPEDFFLANSLLAILIIKGKENVQWIPITFRKRQGGVASVRYLRFIKLGVKITNDFIKYRVGGRWNT